MIDEWSEECKTVGGQFFRQQLTYDEKLYFFRDIRAYSIKI